jgi:hypothetical protein
LDLFRLEYLWAQLVPAEDRDLRGFLDLVHSVTDRMYGALERRLRELPELAAGRRARRIAVVAHLAALGITTMAGLADALDDPLKHGTAELTGLLADLLGGAVEGSPAEA